MRKITLTAVFVSCLLFTTIAYAQLTNQEQEVYYGLIDIMYVNPDGSEEAILELARSHGVSMFELEGIVSKALEKEPTSREWQIYNELWDRIEELPDDDDEAERKRIHREVANKYGLGIIEIYEISFRCVDWDDDW